LSRIHGTKRCEYTHSYQATRSESTQSDRSAAELYDPEDPKAESHNLLEEKQAQSIPTLRGTVKRSDDNRYTNQPHVDATLMTKSEADQV